MSQYKNNYFSIFNIDREKKCGENERYTFYYVLSIFLSPRHKYFPNPKNQCEILLLSTEYSQINLLESYNI